LSQPLTSVVLLNTGPVSCRSGYSNTATWTNTTGNTIYIRSILLWMGESRYLVANIVTYVSRSSDSMLLAWYGQDAYTPGRSPHQWTQNFSPDYFPLSAGASLTINYDCGFLAGGGDAAHYALMWYVTGQP